MGYLMTAPAEGHCEPDAGLLDEPFDLGGGASFGKRPDWLTLEALPADMGLSDRYRAVKATYALFLERPNEILKEGDWEADQVTLRAMQVSIWIATGIRLEWDLMLLMKPGDSEKPCKRWDRLSRQERPLVVPDPTLTRERLGEARQILAVVRALPRKGALWTAIRIGAFGLDERQGDIALVLVWTGLEALFGPDSPGETVHRITMNMGLFLGADGEQAWNIACRARESYKLRSKVVHGRQSGLTQGAGTEQAAGALALLDETIEWLRKATHWIAADSKLRETFQTPKQRARLLDELPFRMASVRSPGPST